MDPWGRLDGRIRVVVTICGFMEGWDIIRCRTVTIAEAMEAWGPYFPIILGTNEPGTT